MSDEIQKTIAARAESLGLSAYAIAKQCDGTPSKETVRRYLDGKCALNSRYVSRLCEVLELELWASQDVAELLAERDAMIAALKEIIDLDFGVNMAGVRARVIAIDALKNSQRVANHD